MDFLSTWVATPNLVLEGNPIAKKLGWKWGIPLNLALCFGFAFWPLSAIVISTTSVLVAARNFQSAWLMRSLGEQLYRDWHVERVQETSVTLYLFCLFAQTALTGGVGAAVIYFSELAAGAAGHRAGHRGLRAGGGLLHPAGRLAHAPLGDRSRPAAEREPAVKIAHRRPARTASPAAGRPTWTRRGK